MAQPNDPKLQKDENQDVEDQVQNNHSSNLSGEIDFENNPWFDDYLKENLKKLSPSPCRVPMAGSKRKRNAKQINKLKKTISC